MRNDAFFQVWVGDVSSKTITACIQYLYLAMHNQEAQHHTYISADSCIMGRAGKKDLLHYF